MSLVSALFLPGFLLTFCGLVTFIVLLMRVDRNIARGDRKNPATSTLVLLWPGALFRWLGRVIDSSRASRPHRRELALARACRAFYVAGIGLMGLSMLLSLS